MRHSSCVFRTPSTIVGHGIPSLRCPNAIVGRVVGRTLPNRLYSLSSNVHRSRTFIHNRCGYRSATYQTTCRNGSVRWYSSSNQGGGASGGGGAGGGGAGGGGGRKGFFQNFFNNLRKGVEKNPEMQDSLKSFHEEREKLHQSYVAQQLRLKFSAALEKMTELGRRGLQGLRTVKDSSSKVLCWLIM